MDYEQDRPPYRWTQEGHELAEELANADGLEVAPVRDIDGESCERCDGESEDADFFSVYVHLREGGASCIADRPTYDEALAYAEELAKAQGWTVLDVT